MKVSDTACFDIYRSCVNAIYNGELIFKVNQKDKEFHFQNWCQKRIESTGFHFDRIGRNTYPDFCLVEKPEGYEIKGLAYPGRENNYDANSNVPTGYLNGRHLFYIFGRYPKEQDIQSNTYPVIDLIMCHGDFLNAQHDYVHKNRHIMGFGTYNDIMIRDRKMYVAPTPFALTEGTSGLSTLILPGDYDIPEDFICVGELIREEGPTIIVGYHFNLQTNTIIPQIAHNPNEGIKHLFRAYRCQEQTNKSVKLVRFSDEKTNGK